MSHKYKAISQINNAMAPVFSATGKTISQTVKRLVNSVPSHYGKSYGYEVWNLDHTGQPTTLEKQVARQ